MLRFLSFALFLTLSTEASPSVTDALQRLDRAARFEDGILASLWGAVETRKAKLLSPTDDVWVQRIQVNSPYFRDGKFKVSLSQRVGRKAPLVIVLAGLFSDSNGALPLRYVYDLSKRGYHVAVIANSWSTEFLEQGPQFKPGEFSLEARAALHVISEVIQKIGRQSVDGVFALGESYGAFLTSVVLAMDHKNIVNRGGLLLGPPVNMSLSMRRLDELIASVGNKSYCRSLWTHSVFVTDMILRQTDAGVNARTKDCAKHVFAEQGFREPLVKTSSRMNYQLFQALSPKERSTLNFSAVVRRFLYPDERLLPPREQFDLGYWLKVARQRHPDLPIRIITAKDDLLNVADQWRNNTFFNFGLVNLTVLSWGGHVGFVMAPEFRLVLEAIFGPTQEDAPPPPPF